MRAGLVAVGTAIAIVGVGVVAGVTLPIDVSNVTRVASADVDQLSSGSIPWSHPFSTTSTDRATIDLTWYASSKANVSWYVAVPCQPIGYCVSGNPLKTWPDNESGTWQTTGAPSSLYCIVVETRNGTPVNLSAQFTEQYRPSQAPLSEFPTAWIVVGGLILLSIGAIATYLGLFLRGGVYDDQDLEPINDMDDPPPRGGPDPP